MKAAPIPRRVRRLVPDLAALMREQKRYWDGDPVSDRGRAQYHGLLAVLAAVTTAPGAVTPQNCWGYDMKTKRCRCKLHRALDDLRALARRRSQRRRRRTAR